jgi:hypothetical protein
MKEVSRWEVSGSDMDLAMMGRVGEESLKQLSVVR